MAHVKESPRDSGQVIILAGYLVAIGIVVISLYLNGLIFAQDLSTRNDGVKDREILGFEQETERAATEIARSIGNNSTGNITEDDLFEDTGDVTDNYEYGMKTYGLHATSYLEGRQSIAEIENNSVEIAEEDTVWSVGQRKMGDLENEDGDSNFYVINDTASDFGDDMEVLEIEVNITDFSDVSEFGFGAYSGGLPDVSNGVGAGLSQVPEWSLSFNTSKSTDELVINGTGLLNNEQEVISKSWGDNDNFSIRIVPNENGIMFVNGVNETSNADLYEGELSGGENLIISGDGGIEASYEIRLDGSNIDDVSANQDYITGPCGTDGNDQPCVDTSGNELHAVATVDNGSFKYSYFDGNAEYTRTITGIKTEQEELPLELVEP